MENRSKIIEALALGEYMQAIKIYDEAACNALLTTGIPRGLRVGLIRHIIAGGHVGGFLNAFLNNDLRGAVIRADGDSIRKLHELVQFIYSHSPRDCHGSYEKVKAWRERGGLLGRVEEEEAPL